MYNFFYLIIIITNIFSQDLQFRGQLWFGSESKKNQSNVIKLGYLPTLYNRFDFKSNKIDLEYSYYIDRQYIRNAPINTNNEPYRYWIRYSINRFEARLGLQKIAFGSAKVLRPMAWFDEIDIRDPLSKTKGVEALRLRYFTENNYVFWFWLMQNDHKEISFGGRGEISTKQGEWGITLHHDPSEAEQIIGQIPFYITESHTRLGLEFRYDGFIGSWFEGVSFIKKNNASNNWNQNSMFSVGMDYTIPIGGGLLIMSELLNRNGGHKIELEIEEKQTLSVFSLSLPLGIVHQLMAISSQDWKNNKTYNYLRWSVIYDTFSVNSMVSIDSDKIGNQLQFTLIYNH